MGKTCNLLVKQFPYDLMRRIHMLKAKRSTTVREIVREALSDYLNRSGV